MPLSNYLEDDWDDNALSGRSSPEKDVYYSYGDGGGGDLLKGVYRPLWTVENGSLSATNQRLESGDGSSTTNLLCTTSNLTVGSWSADYVFSSSPSSGNLYWHLWAAQAGNQYQWEVKNGQSYALSKRDSSGSTDVITGSGGGETSTNTMEVSRDSYGNWELLKNGTSEGTSTDTYTPENIYHNFRDQTDTQCNIDNLVIQ